MYLIKLVDKIHTWINSLIKDRFPMLSLYFYTKPRLYWYRRSQPLHQLLKGNLKSDSTEKSILFFTVHKSASTFMNSFLTDLGNESKLLHIDYNGYFAGFSGPDKNYLKNKDLLKKVFIKKGFIYGPLRFYLEIDNIDDYKVVLLLRDPRDVLTSQFFSVRNTHPLITERYIERRKIALKSTIDEHVRMEADRFFSTYKEYIDKLLGRPNVLFLKYEDMITNFNSFISKINSHMTLNLTPEQLKKLDRTSSFVTQTEDLKSHKRKVAAGDHKEKLKPETIEWLNRKFETILAKLDYPLRLIC